MENGCSASYTSSVTFRATCLAAARSRSGSNNHLGCYSLPPRRFATLEGKATVGQPLRNKRHIFVTPHAGGGTPPLRGYRHFREQTAHLRTPHMRRHRGAALRLDGIKKSKHPTKNATYYICTKKAPVWCLFCVV